MSQVGPKQCFWSLYARVAEVVVENKDLRKEIVAFCEGEDMVRLGVNIRDSVPLACGGKTEVGFRAATDDLSPEK